MAVTKCINANASKANGDAATIAKAGNVPTGGLNSSVTLISLAKGEQPYGSHVTLAVSEASSGNLGTLKAYTAGAYQTMDPTSFVMKIAGTKIAGVTTSLFRGGANWVSQRPVNKIKVTHTGFLTAVSWSSNRDGQPTYTLTQSAQAPDFGNDDEVTGLGNLAYRTGKPLPVQGTYPTKYSN